MRATNHTLSYAYPTSENAVFHRHGATGCWIFSVPGVSSVSAKTLDELLEKIDLAATPPARFSIDHPSNRMFLTGELRNQIDNHVNAKRMAD
jgi:hypothetical protein